MLSISPLRRAWIAAVLSAAAVAPFESACGAREPAAPSIPAPAAPEPKSPAIADLDTYLRRPEPEATWEKRSDERDGDVQVVQLALTSQVWRGIPWKHDLHVFRPVPAARPGLAVLLITGFRLGGVDRATGAQAARACGAPVAILYGVPNQPLFGGLLEDNLVAHTFTRYVETGDAEWPLLFPMVKSAVKAMDAVQALSGREWRDEVRRFVLTGASKRGWTCWLAAAADDRVTAIAPLVFDNLNFGPQMRNQIATWGEYSDRIADYTRRKLQALMETERGKRLVEMVDPYACRARLDRIPKLIVNGTNDPYWPLDSLNLYWDGLGGEKAVVYVPNGGHGIVGHASEVNARVALVHRVASGRPLPPLRWSHGESGGKLTLRMTCAEAPASGRLWVACAPSRDFRRAKWEVLPARRDGDALAGEVDRPADGCLALFGEADFKEGERTFGLSTAVRIAGGR